MHDVMPVYTNISQIFIGYYTILQLTTNDDDRIYQCEVTINSSPLVTVTDDIMIDIAT